MNDEQKRQLLDSCKQVLEDNWRDNFTIPAGGLYPHQWLWDSCFIAIGKSNYDIEQACMEIKSLLRGQWSNGMLPHMIFSNHGLHKTDRNIWQSWRNANAPDDISTTGLTQPPMIAEAIVKIGEKMSIRDRRSWYQDMFRALVSYHEWMYTERDPHNEGLILLIHPWESGLDNSPPWINQMHMHNKPWWIKLVEKTRLDKMFLLVRRDTQHVPPGQRLNNIDALLYYSVLQRLKRKNWDTDTILNRSHFAVEDLAFNSIFIRANEHLREIAKTIGHKLPKELLEKMDKSEEALDKLWDAYYEQYFSRNFVTHKLIKEPSISTLLPLYSGAISKERAAVLVKKLHDKKLFDSPFPVASVPLSSEWYKELGYWQGPTWINTNWLIIDGLKRYGYIDEANKISEASLKLVNEHGSYEYFSAQDGTPAGTKDFSWTASLIIDLLK